MSMYTKIYSAVNSLGGGDKSRHKHAFVSAGFRFHVCVCNSTPVCFLKKAGVQEKLKGCEDLWKRIYENVVRRG